MPQMKSAIGMNILADVTGGKIQHQSLMHKELQAIIIKRRKRNEKRDN
jgi:hypothetical protein